VPQHGRVCVPPSSTGSEAAAWPAALLQQVDAPGPRDNAYPSAEHFVADHGDGAALRALSQRSAIAARGAAAPARPLALYVHIPFCEAVCHYCGCHKVVTPHRSRAAEYLDALEQEIELVRDALREPATAVAQLHLGGGTPTFLAGRELQRLLAALRRAFRVDGRTQASIEADARTATPEQLGRLRELGFQHISYGIQDLDPQVQHAVNRVQPQETVARALAGAHELGFSSVNADLICGLPCQTPPRFAHTVQAVAEMRPTHVTLYRYVHAPQRFRSQRRIAIVDLPAREHSAGMLADAGAWLQARGYQWAGADRYALPGGTPDLPRGDAFPAGTDVIGFGVSAVSRLGAGCHQNAATLAGYYEALAGGQLPVARGLALTGDDLVRQAVIGALMTTGHVDFEAIERAHGIHLPGHFAPEFERLQPFVASGAVEIGAGALQLTPAGRVVARAVALVFDRYLHREPAGARRPRRR
jgi:oxygen-independent coproporphyrinogen-3 oxidase